MASPRSAAILALTGGGVMARFSTAVLESVQELRTPAYPEGDREASVAEAFDILAGTSAGALICAGLAVGRSPSELSDLLETHGPLIFPTAGWRRNLRWVLSAKYDPEPLRDAVDVALQGETPLLGDFQQTLAFMAIDETNGVPVVLSNANPEHLKVPLHDAVLASASAPTYFPAHRIPSLGNRRFIDGGLFANAPDVGALTILRNMHRSLQLDHLHVLSVGTTRDDAGSPFGDDHAGAGGILPWAARPPARLLKLAMRGTTDHAVDLMNSLALGDYIRLDAEMEGLELDSATPEAMQKLAAAGGDAYEALPGRDRERLKGFIRRRRHRDMASSDADTELS